MGYQKTSCNFNFFLKVLSDENKRQMYDATGHSEYTSQGGRGAGGGHPFTSSQAEEIFRQFFGGDLGGFGSMFHGGQDFSSENVHQLVLNLSFDEAVQGCSKEVSMRVQGACERCHGSGGEPGTKEQTCPYCRGRGEVSVKSVCKVSSQHVVLSSKYYWWQILFC